MSFILVPHFTHIDLWQQLIYASCSLSPSAHLRLQNSSIANLKHTLPGKDLCATALLHQYFTHSHVHPGMVISHHCCGLGISNLDNITTGDKMLYSHCKGCKKWETLSVTFFFEWVTYSFSAELLVAMYANETLETSAVLHLTLFMLLVLYVPEFKLLTLFTLHLK